VPAAAGVPAADDASCEQTNERVEEAPLRFFRRSLAGFGGSTAGRRCELRVS
jgi:hypothetical protein